MPYRQLTPTTAITALQAIPGLRTRRRRRAWTVERRKTDLHDHADRLLGRRQPGRLRRHQRRHFCGGAGRTTDLNPDDYKRVTVNVAWTQPRRDARHQAGGHREQRGQLGGPAVEFTSQTPTGTEIKTPCPNVRFDVQADADAVAIRFAVDGVLTRTSTSTSATFDWDIDSGGTHVPDGTYVVSVTALDKEGVAGPDALEDDPPQPRRPDGAAGRLRRLEPAHRLLGRARHRRDAVEPQHRAGRDGLPRLPQDRGQLGDRPGLRLRDGPDADRVPRHEPAVRRHDRLLRRGARRGPVRRLAARGPPSATLTAVRANTQPNQAPSSRRRRTARTSC